MILIVLLSGTINFHLQPVLYYTPLTAQDSLGIETPVEDIFYLEFNCAIPYSELSYKEIGGKIIADCRIDVKLINKNQTDSLLDSLFARFTIPSFSQAARERTTFYLRFGNYIPFGEYEYAIRLSSADNAGTIKGVCAVNDKDYTMSDILLAKSISLDTAESYLTKGNLKIVPNPSGVFEQGTTNLFIYYELYNLKPGMAELEIRYLVSDTSGKIIRKITRKLERRSLHQAVNIGLNIEGFAPGDYLLRVTVGDTLLEPVVEKSIGFTVKRKEEKFVEAEDLPYYDAIEYFVSTKEYRYFLTLKDEGRKMYLKKFWEKHNYTEISERYEYADGHFQEGQKSGSKTDRGRIYIKYGPPDEIENKQFEESKPYEHWQYYNGTEFIFVDIRGTQEYTLVWTNARDEKSKPALYYYLPNYKKREIYDVLYKE